MNSGNRQRTRGCRKGGWQVKKKEGYSSSNLWRGVWSCALTRIQLLTQIPELKTNPMNCFPTRVLPPVPTCHMSRPENSKGKSTSAGARSVPLPALVHYAWSPCMGVSRSCMSKACCQWPYDRCPGLACPGCVVHGCMPVPNPFYMLSS